MSSILLHMARNKFYFIYLLATVRHVKLLRILMGAYCTGDRLIVNRCHVAEAVSTDVQFCAGI